MQEFSVGDIGIQNSNLRICLYGQDTDPLTAIPNFITLNSNSTFFCLYSIPWKPLWFKWFNHKKTGFEPQKTLFKVLITQGKQTYIGYLEEDFLTEKVIWKSGNIS